LKNIEDLVIDLFDKLPDTSSTDEINKLVKISEREVYPDFYVVDTLKSGVIYLHGRMPDIIKEYLEYKFNNLSILKYIVANTVILEGINIEKN